MEGEKTLYMHHDHLGSVIAYSDESGKLVEELSYDAWGRRRNPDTWEYYDLSSSDVAIYDSGFTGHIDAMYNGKWAGHMYKKPINVGFY